MDEWASGSSRDVHDTLAEMDRRLSELQRDLAGVSARSSRPTPPPPPPPPPPAPREELQGVEERLSRIAEEARLQADALAKRIDDLTGLRDELERSASQLADAAERARRAQGRSEAEVEVAPSHVPELEPELEAAAELEAEEALAEEPLPPPPTRGDSFSTEPSPPSWLASEHVAPLEPATPPLAEEDAAPAIDDLEEKGPTVEEPAPEEPAAEVEEPVAEVEEAAPAAGRTVSLDAGPFADIVALSAFEEMLDRLPTVTEVYVRGLEGNRAHIELQTTATGSLVEEIRGGVPLAFSVARDEGDDLTINVEGIAPI